MYKGLLTVGLDKAPWAPMLRELEYHSGIQLREQGTLVRTVTDAFENLPVEQELWRLFRGANMGFLYKPAAGVSRDG